MKKILFCLMTFVAIIICCAGCDPKKNGGGGKSQSYDSHTGKYK